MKALLRRSHRIPRGTTAGLINTEGEHSHKEGKTKHRHFLSIGNQEVQWSNCNISQVLQIAYSVLNNIQWLPRVCSNQLGGLISGLSLKV